MDSRIMDDKVKPDAVPRMMGDADVALVQEMAGRLGPGARLVEVGPWLGGVSRILAGHGELHVIDRFLWSEKNAENYPGIAQPGESFRARFEANLADAPHPVKVHEADFRSFVWTGGRIDLCLIDAPRSAADLLDCLRGLRTGLDGRSLLLVKNGLSPAHPELPAVLEVLLGQGFLVPVPTRQPRWCNLLAVAPGPDWARLPAPEEAVKALAGRPLAAGLGDPWGGPTLALGRIAERLRRGDWAGAVRRLAEVAPAPGSLLVWDGFERALDRAPCGPDGLAILAELLAVQTDPAAGRRLPLPANRGPIPALRAYWTNSAPQPWRAADFDADLIVTAVQQGAMDLPAALGPRILGKRVLEIGPEPDLSGMGFLTGGASGYLGLVSRPPGRAMTAAASRMTALRYILTTAATAGDLQEIDLAVVRDDTRTSPETARVLAALPARVPQVTVRRGRHGAGFDIA
jgi:hypothetical protein